MPRRIALNLVALCIGIFVALATAEVLTRILHPLSTVEYFMDPEVGPILAPHQHSRWVNEDYDVAILTNSAGFHDVEHAITKSPWVYRILVLGDSYIEGLQVPIDQNFTRQLERMVRGWLTEKQVEVINLGVSGSGPAQYYRILEKKGLLYRPDLVLMAVLPDNDFRDSYRSLSGAVFKPYYALRTDESLEYIAPQVSGLGAGLRPFLRRSAFLHLVRQATVSMPVEGWLAGMGLLAPAGAIQQGSARISIPEDWYVYVADPPEPWPEAYQMTLRMIRESKELAERHGAKFLVMLIASTAMVEQRWEEMLRKYPAAQSITWDFAKPFQEIDKLGKESGFVVINLLQPFRQDFLETGQSHSWPHDGHWNERGHRLAAEVVNAHLHQHRVLYRLN
ncbi:MAG TPA: hypothetical protein VNK46_12810 [Nitrospiraceae bacterium]|nr:hypothetical protein [Nitrospiraceae bacterium]